MGNEASSSFVFEWNLYKYINIYFYISHGPSLMSGRHTNDVSEYD